ncbi:hypothetical protein [Mucilaginibacter segetis]|uniref:Uncharacterized protein n=1 Tax=Mucilaginibacter segetis TaxID=2793071 RepID=A0A934PWD3_9SPHI|nr:hypothetical protein [Mucilaginibacter segetis]MBK0380892.1 hypothetical protein [Mucilaginibacter segetis]
MKDILYFISIIILNIALFIVLQIMSQFAHFFLFGEGALSDKFIAWVSLFFTIIQIGMLNILYLKRVIIKTQQLLIINIIIVGGLYIYCNKVGANI